MAKNVQTSKKFTTVSGSNTHVVLEFPSMGGQYMLLGSAITVSYQVYRTKAPVFNCGNNLIDGFAIGQTYVAGSVINTMFMEDELSNFIKQYSNVEEIKNSEYADYVTRLESDQSLKSHHTFMKDDLTSFNMHIIFTSEYHEDATRIILYDCNFINHGQVMSVNDMITEGTMSFVARDIREQHKLGETTSSIGYGKTILKASDLI